MYCMVMMCGLCVSVSARLCPAFDLWSATNALHYLAVNIIRFCHVTYYFTLFYKFQRIYKYLHCAKMQELCYGHVFLL
jgi:hypothetical protein